MLRVVPLFETLDDLEYAETAMRQLFSTPWYFEHIQGKQVGLAARRAWEGGAGRRHLRRAPAVLSCSSKRALGLLQKSTGRLS